MTAPNRASGAALAAWVASIGAEASAPIDEGVPYRRLRMGRTEPVGAVVVTLRGRRWYYRQIETRAAVERRAMVDFMMIGGVL